MPTCRKCQTSFPNRVRIGNKLKLVSNRKFCLTCSPYGKHNTRKLDKDDTKKACSSCKKTFPTEAFRLYKHNGREKRFCYCPECDSNRVKKAARLRKEKAVAYKGGKCENCGYSKCLRALEFHHRDPEKKDIGISQFKQNSFEKIKSELDKCQLLCANCHRETHEHLDLGNCGDNHEL